MQDQSPLPEQPTPAKTTSRASVGVIAGLSAVVLATAGMTTWLTVRQFSPSLSVPTTSTIAPNSSQTAQNPTQVPVEQSVQVYWLKDTGTRMELVPAEVRVPANNQPAEVLKGAFEQLLKGPADPAIASTIPANTQLRSLEIRADGIHLDLSQEFTSGGGSAAMTGRLAQVLYTATALDPGASVWIAVEGKPLETLGGEGIMVDQPMTRSNFEQNFQL